MIHEDVFGVEPWAVPERGLHLELLPQSEAIFALSNGHIGLRGSLDEGEPSSEPGSYLNGFYENRPLPHAEAGYGYPETGQSLINVPNGKVIRLLVDDEPFDLRYGEVQRHERVLDLRDGVLHRHVLWVSPAGQAVRLRTTRLVSFVQRSVAAILYEVQPVGASARIVVQSELHRHNGLRAEFVHQTRVSGLRVAAGMDHDVEGPDGTVTTAQSEPDLARLTVSTELEPGTRLRMVKYLAYGWSSRRSLPALRDQVDAALAACGRTGWDGLRRGQRAYLDDVWDRADIELDGDPALQQAVRFSLFHVVQAAARAERRAIPAKGLTGRGYDGHSFWDLESYTLPVLTCVAPQAARDALVWRHSTLGMAEDRARELSLRGAMFPWRTISGPECSGYWPAGTAAVHVNADIAEAVRRYLAATGDEEFEQGAGLELLVATARLWRSVGHHDVRGGFRIDGVTGPDEYSALADNNVYTNLMAARNLREAAALAARHPQRAGDLHVDDEEIASWRDAADAMIIPTDEHLGITPQSDCFTHYRHWDFERLPHDDHPLLLRYPYYLLYSSQVVKQADLVFALYTCGDRFSAEQKARDFDYYERITVRDSSLSACVQGVVAAEVGHVELAYDYLGETAFIDLRDLAFNTRDGVHLAALAGSWLVAVAGFGGMRDHGDTLAFAPRLPERLTRLTFRLLYRGRRLRVVIGRQEASYELIEGDQLEIDHHGERLTLEFGAPQSRVLPAVPQRAQPEQPPGRSPQARHRET